MPTTKARMLCSLTFIASLAVLTATPAVAAEQQTGESHCLVQMTADGFPQDPVCFETEAQRDAFAVSREARSTSDRSASASTHIGTVWKDGNYRGSSMAYWGANGCAGRTFPFSSNTTGWGISSVKAANGCWATLYTAASYGGAKLNCTPNCAALGTWNDSVRSLIFRPKGTFG